MNIIEQMLQDQKDGKLVRISDYYNDSKKFYDDFEIYKIMHQIDSKLKRELDILVQTIKEQYDSKIFYLDKDFINTDSNYKERLRNLLVLYKTNKEEAYKEAFKYKQSQREFNKIISFFKQSYINADLYMDDLLDIANYIYIHSNYYQSHYTQKKDFKIDLINKVYDSNLSFVDYSFYNVLDSNFDKYTLPSLEKINTKKYNEIISREDTTKEQIIEIINKIRDNKIDVIEYYELTNLNPVLLLQQVKKYKLLNNNFKLFIRKLSNSASTTLDSELKTKLVISQEEVTEELKRKAFDYLDQINAPYTITTYNTMIRKLIKKN